MDNKQEEKKMIKTIVPIKGNLLERVRNKYLKLNGTSSKNIETNDVINNNSQNEINNTSDKPVIHKVEHVNFKISEILNQPIEKIPEADNFNQLEAHQSTNADEINPPSNSIQEDASNQIPIKLLTAKMPENTFNSQIPLKMVRTIRPVTKPILVRKRFGNVQIHTKTKEIPPAFSITIVPEKESEMELEINTDVQPERIEIKTPCSDEEDLRGFCEKSSENIASKENDGLQQWFHCLSNKGMDVLENAVNIASSELVNPVSSEENSMDVVEHKIEPSIMYQSNEIEPPIINQSNEIEQCTTSGIDNLPVNEIEPCTSSRINNFLANEIESCTSSRTNNLPVNEIKSTVSLGTQTIPLEEEEEMVMDTNEVKWLNDIASVIGEARIQEIDNSLQKIPSIVTGNKIQTENVELKLIINHLLKKLKADSVSDTLPGPSSYLDQLKDMTSDEDFMFDSFSDDDDDDQSLQETINTNNTNENSSEIKSHDIPSTSEKVEVPTCEKKQDVPLVEIKLPLIEENNKLRKRKGEHLPIATSTAKKIKKSKQEIETDAKVEGQKIRFSKLQQELVINEKILKAEIKLSKTEVFEQLQFQDSSDSSTTPTAPKRKGRPKKNMKTQLEAVQIKKVTRVQELKTNDNNSSAKRKLRNSKSVSSSECESSEKTSKVRGRPKNTKCVETKPVTDEIINKKEPTKKTPINFKISDKKDGQKKIVRTRKILSDSDSENDDVCNSNGLNSDSISNAFNSNSPLSLLECTDQSNQSSSLDKINAKKVDHPVIEKLEEVISIKKRTDPTYIEPSKIEKRPYLRTSAFTGNSDDENINTDLCTKDDPSVSHDSSSHNSNETLKKKNGQTKITQFITGSQNKNEELKNKMKQLINEKKEKIESSLPAKNEAISPHSTPKSKRHRGRQKIEKNDEVSKQEFDQAPLELAIERLVPYNELIEAVRITEKSKIGRSKNQDGQKKEEIEMQLRKMEYFYCGNCHKLVTKHRWKDHVIDHGGLAWVDKLELPIDICEWNEAIRRLNNYIRIYQLDCLRCPNCREEKRSALGHLSHIYVCGEDEETVEKRKNKCEHCGERVLPYNMNSHRLKCTSFQKKTEKVISDNDSNDEDVRENSRSSSLHDSNVRLKRKAVKRAEKKFKSILQDPADHKELGEDYEASSSNASIPEDDESETEGSSGEPESDSGDSVIEDNENSNDSIIISNRKGKASHHDTQEMKNARKVLSGFPESFPASKISSKTIALMKEFSDEFLNLESLLSKLLPNYKISQQSINLFLSSLHLNKKSMNYFCSTVDKYHDKFDCNSDIQWNQLDFGDCYGDKQSLTFYCGASVTALDWAPSNNEMNYLAVACNQTSDVKMNLEKTSKACIQIYRITSLVNEKFEAFTKTSKLMYMFEINEGPIWAIKFHPNVISSVDRIGILAVTSANQNVFVYTLPYLNNDKTLIITLTPTFICKISNNILLYQDKYLMQATKLAWIYRKDCINALTAGFINGFISIWKIDEDEKHIENKSTVILPYIISQPHQEVITAIDIKYTVENQIHILTGSLDRELKVFALENVQMRDIAQYYSPSRISCAEWWIHWPGYLYGNDNSLSNSAITHRQPLDFGMKNYPIIQPSSSVTDFSINHWLNFIMIATDVGDVIGSNPSQMISTNPKDRWEYFSNGIHSYTDLVKIAPKKGDKHENHGIVFNDFKTKFSKRPKNWRVAPCNSINQLQINQICFNRNEMSYRFYALGYETGFIRIKHLKNSK